MERDITPGGYATAPAAEAHDTHETKLSWHLLLLAATLVTTTWAGALHQGVDLLKDPGRWTIGVSYALALIAILGIHEMGHYLLARRRGVEVSLPYFIPAPMFLGTFGAFIRMRGAVRDRAAYFDIAVAGPLAGLVAALVTLAVGLPGESGGAHAGMTPASSMLFAGIYALATGLPVDAPVQLGPLAFAGWLGLIVTALNLIPVGQLDGGHIAYAWIGRRRAVGLGTALLVLMVAAGLFYSSHWLMWALIVWALAGREHPPAVDEETPLSAGRQVLAGLSFALLAAIVLPWPRAM